MNSQDRSKERRDTKQRYNAALGELRAQGASKAEAIGTPSKYVDESAEREQQQQQDAILTKSGGATSASGGEAIRERTSTAPNGDSYATQGWVTGQIGGMRTTHFWGVVAMVGVALVMAVTGYFAFKSEVHEAKTDVETQVTEVKGKVADHDQRIRGLEIREAARRKP